MKYINKALKNKINNKKKKQKISLKKINLFILILFIFFSGIWTERFDLKLNIKKFSNQIIDTSANRIYSAFSKQDKKLVIDITYKNYMKILETRAESIKSYRASEDIHKWVPGKMSINNKNYKIEIKLKGVHSEHWKDPNKWSFKIKLIDGQSLDGIRRFSIQHPKTRDYLYEWLFMKALKKENLISHRNLYLETIVNGNNLGIYYLEEQHSKNLIENNKRREGPIIGLDKNSWIKEVNNLNRLTVNSLEDTFWRAKIKPVQFQDDKIGTEQEIYLKNAMSLFEDFRKNKSKLNEVFDTKQLATLMAIKAIFGTVEFDWRDIKFYYNPLTSLLEPIGREVHIIQDTNNSYAWWIDNSKSEFLHSLDQKDFLTLIYNDMDFYKLYLSELYRLSEKDYLKKIINENKKDFAEIRKKLKINYPTNNIFSEKHLEKTRVKIRDTLNPVQGINAFFINYKNDYIYLAIQNTQRLPVEINSIKLNNNQEIFIKKPKIIQGKQVNKPTKNFFLKIPCPVQLDCSVLKNNENKISYNILGQNIKKEEKLSRFFGFKENESKKKLAANIDQLKKYDFLSLNIEKKEINFNQDKINITKTLIFPKDFVVNLKSGTELIFSENGQIISYSPINIIGLKDNPVIIRSNFNSSLENISNTNALNNFGYGISVINANSKSIIKNTIFKNLSAPDLNTGMGFLGSINFYQSDVVIENSKFLSNLKGDDYLNIVASKFEIRDVEFFDIRYDAIDFDFSNGSIENISIVDSNNDGLDFSGSNVKVSNVFINNVKDKGISVGEKSNIDIENIILKNTNIAVASKDLSKVKINDIEVENSNIAIAAYQKKPEFGPGFASIQNIVLKNVIDSYIVEKNSEIEVNNQKMPFSEINFNKF